MALAVVIPILSSALYCARDAADFADEFRPGAGALIVNINTATQQELETVPGIGPSRAAQIIAHRPYDSIEELVQIAGIGEKTLESLRPFVVVDGETERR